MLHFDIEDKKSFEFSVGDVTYAIPAFSELPADLSNRLMEAFATDGDDGKRGLAILKAFMAILDAYAAGCTSVLNQGQIQALMAAWDAFTEDQTGADLGE